MRWAAYSILQNVPRHSAVRRERERERESKDETE